MEVDFTDLKETLLNLLKEQENPPWSLIITRVGNGYILRGHDDDIVIEEDDLDELNAHEKLLWEVMEYFNFCGTKHDKERLKIIRERGDNYNPKAKKIPTGAP